MPVPTPSGESKTDFMHTCVSELMDNGHEQDQAVAICLKQWGGAEGTSGGETVTTSDATKGTITLDGDNVIVSFAMKIVEKDGQYCCLAEDGSEKGCYDTRAEAQAAIADAYGEKQAKASGTAFKALITLEGKETNDGRMFEINGLEPRPVLPIPLMVQDRAEHGGIGGDTTSWFAGAIEKVYRDKREPTRWMGEGHLMANQAGQDAEDLIRGGLIGLSVDAAAQDVTLDIRAVSQDGMPHDVLVRYDRGTIMGATVTPFPAFHQATIWLEDMPEPAWIVETAGGEIPLTEVPMEVEVPTLLLASSGGPAHPPIAWFQNPELDGPCPLTIEQDGRAYGHIALWQTCHIGSPETCVTAPTSPSSYAYFHTGEVVTLEGERLAVGTLTMNTGHAGLRDSASSTMAHYDHTGTAALDIRVGEDDHGIWCAGAVRPGLTDANIRALMAAAPSGDWRRINGYLELVAVLAVNVPGFPIPRTQARVASGAEQALVAAPGPGVMAWDERFLTSRTTEEIQAHIKRLVVEMVNDEMRRRLAELKPEPLTPEQARLRHVKAAPLAAPKTAHEKRVAELVTAGRDRDNGD